MTALTLLPLPIIALGIFFILRFWHALDLLGFRDEVLRRDSSLATADLVAICTGSAFIVGTIYGIASDTPPLLLCAVSVGGLPLFAHLYARTNHATIWAATRIEALRTVAALRLISAAELAYALRVLDSLEKPEPLNSLAGQQTTQQVVREER